MDVAKSADGHNVLAQTSWNWHDSIGCYLTLDDASLKVLRADPAPHSPPGGETEASVRCFGHHQFGRRPVDVAKSVDHQTVLARLSWGYHVAIGCYLTLDERALSILRGATAGSTTEPGTEHEAVGLVIAPPLLEVGEGHSVVYTVKLASRPTAAVTVTITLGGSPDVVTDESLLTFTAFNWDIAQTVTVAAGLDADAADDSATLAHVASGGGYDGVDAEVIVTIVDDASLLPDPPAAPAVTSGRYHTCAIQADQAAVCWGDSEHGQADAPVGKFTQVSAGWEHTCGIRADWTAICWGLNRNGKADAPSGRLIDVSAGGSHSCGIRPNRTAVCWGLKTRGATSAPEGEFTDVSAGGSHTCGIKSDGTIACWGSNEWGQVDAPAGQFTHISAGWQHSCGIRTDQTINCWGLNESFQSDSPAGEFTHISADDFHSCGVRVDQTIICWGANSHGQSGAPYALFTSVAAGWSHTCGVTIGGSIYCWGANDNGQSDAPNIGESLAEMMEQRTDLIYRSDSLRLIAFANLARAYTIGTDIWVVWACDTEAGTLENDPVQMADRFTAWIQPYFTWLSGGTYLPEFIAGGTVQAETEQDCYSNIRNTPSPKQANGAVIVIDLAMIDCGTPADCRIGGGGLATALTATWKNGSPKSVLPIGPRISGRSNSALWDSLRCPTTSLRPLPDSSWPMSWAMP